MQDDEILAKFNVRLLDIAYKSFALGEKIRQERLVRKVLRSLPKKFDMKITAIEEAQDISSLKVDELFGSLLTFEMSWMESLKTRIKEFLCNPSVDVEHDDADIESEDLLDDWKVLDVQKERSGTLMADNHRHMTVVAYLKRELNQASQEVIIFRIYNLSTKESKRLSLLKLIIQSLMALQNSLKYSAKRDWYFDSGSSHHMIGNKNGLSDIKLINSRKVTFGDGASEKIIGKENFNFLGLPS
ncbi:uncharacterized protein LOC120080043 [Benincasa hispida]|uniref:uncharacterized protein LOC120080043 n=1 Tax=Benincasa hispida TaxID=102211 RepID=UPI001901E55C|nr:uncharacterized protein LOC120080043 [Benincasa hispida]